ncbi:CGNR zinc finger domain-containing protein [Allonocardiopsis opalescens]|uniref:Putative RNA-binding Zn ribbon-like protein n=1 Tax=Allonocardiopsis opalescens TaxID=1144618 RepID=A0A2T0PXM9_9ACTN|nr:ABATE domain-containing protein [Allonocardiopsis opalescens]PRX96291.1 putative RNA-binding Zn ribbon-like protein [Allonocardiopsis opalescens]
MIGSANSLLMHKPEEGVTWRFDPGALPLELMVTGGPGALERFEMLHEPADLASWAALSRLRLDPAGVEVTAGQLDAVRALRAALWRLAPDLAHGRPADPEATAVLNRAAEGAPLVPQIGPDGGARWARPADGGQILSTMARDAVELFTGPLAGRVRECAAHDCPLVFVDASRPGRRRWCAMERCGNRAKVRALRARRGDQD